MSPPPDHSAYSGTATPFSGNSQFNQMSFVAKHVLRRQATAALVQVVGVTSNGEAAPVGYVDVKPLVHQIDGQGNPTPHGTIYKLPYLRMQGGNAAVIMDPKVGDIGLASFCSHDISNVKATKKASPPASRRRFSWSDGIYHGGMLNGSPEHFVRFHPDGVEISTPNKVTINAATGVDIQTPMDLTISARNFQLDAAGDAVAKGDIVVNAASAGTAIRVSTHHHLGVQPGAGESGQPKPGT